MKLTLSSLFFAVFIALIAQIGAAHAASDKSLENLTRDINAKFAGQIPKLWGSNNIPGVRTRFATKEKAVALTFDACGPDGGYDAALIDFLIARSIPATLFLNGRWIDKNPGIFQKLASNPLFEIANHGTRHKPLSVTGRSVYGINGTQNIAEAVAEVEINARKIKSLTGKRPRFFRSGTAFYDEISVKIAHTLGHEVAGHSVLGDAGATYSRTQVKKALLSAKPGDIILLHMNRPGGMTAEGTKDGVLALLAKGYRFVKLSLSDAP